MNYRFTKNKKIRRLSVQEYLSDDRAEVRVDTRIQSSCNFKYNEPDIFILDKPKKEVVIVEVGITTFDNLRAVEVEKKNKYDMLVSSYSSMKQYEAVIMPYVVTWDVLVTKFHRQYKKILKINKVEAYIQSKVLKMTLESLTMDARRGEPAAISTTEEIQEIQEDPHANEGAPISI